MKELVKKYLKLDQMPKLDDTTDALAMAICYTQSYKMSKYTSTKNEKFSDIYNNQLKKSYTRKLEDFVDKSKIINKK